MRRPTGPPKRRCLAAIPLFFQTLFLDDKACPRGVQVVAFASSPREEHDGYLSQGDVVTHVNGRRVTEADILSDEFSRAINKGRALAIMERALAARE